MSRLNRISFLILVFLLSISAAWGAARSNMPPGVQSFAPTGTVTDNVSFRAVFRNPVVNKNQTGKVITPENSSFPIELNPPVQLEGRWQNERTFTAKLLAPLKNATTYTAKLKDNLRDRRGNKIGPGTFRFQTEGLSPTDIKASMGKDGNAYFSLGFNMRVDPARLKGFMSILNAQGREMPYNINGALPSRVIRVAVPVEKLSSRQRFTVKIAAGLKSGEGDLGFEKDFSENVVLDPELMLQSLYTSEGEIRATFNFGIDPASAKSFINIEPAPEDIAFESSWSDETIILRASDFKPRSRFVLTFRKGFPSKGGLVLKEDHKQAVIMPDLDSEVKLPAAGTYLAALDKGLIPVELLNVKKLQLDLWRMYENNIPYVLKNDYDYFQKDIANRIFTSEIDLSLPLNERVRRAIPIEEIAKGERGLLLLTARDAEKEWWDETSQMINLSDMGATARLWEDAILIWVNTLTTANAINEATVKIYSDKKQLLAEGKTNLGGIFYYELPEGTTWQADNQPDLAIISKKNGEQTDLTYVQLTRNLLDREIFDTSGRDWLRSGYDAVIFSPRDIYRTGESATFKAVVRNSDMTTPETFPVLFIIRDTLGRKVKQESVMLNARGSAVMSLNLPGNALTGLWTASLAVPGSEEKPIAIYNFHVEDFAPPRLEVKLNSYRQFLIHNDTFTADIYARWLFGVDGAGLNYKTSWTAREGTFTPTQDRWKSYNFGDPDRHFTFTNGELEEGKQLDNFGAAHTEFKLEEDWQAPTIINVTLRAEVMEDSGRWVTSSITRPYFPAPYLLGIAPVNEVMTVKNDAVFKVAAVAPNEEPADPGELNAELYKVTWNYNMVEIDGRKRWQSSEELSQVSEKTLTLKNGLGEVSFRPEEYGSYLVKISDADDNARAVYSFYATDPEYAGRGAQLIDRIEMTSEKESYRLGETARITIKAPFEGLMLIAVENSKLIKREVRKVDSSEVTFEIPITQEFRPNAWISAWLIRPVNAEDAKGWAGHRAIGLMRIKTDISDFDLNVAIEAPKKIEPASKLPVTITLNGASEAISRNADVAIALVDDGVLGLTNYQTPDLLNYFWGLKKLNSQGFDIYDQLIPVEDRTTEQLHPAGDEALGALAANGDVQRFKILSLFEGVLYPDDKGVIKTELDIPEFSGRGRLFVVAASGRSFGKAEEKIEIARAIVTETGLPRFAAPGDIFAVPVSVFNTSGANQNVKINLTPEGLMLNESFADLKIPAGEKANFVTQARALGGSSKTVLKIQTSWNENGAEKSFTQDIEMPVRSAWPVITLGGSGIFENGVSKLELPLNDFVGDVAGSLTLADTPAVNLTQAIEYLNNYPYACLEQTISGAWPFLILPDAVAEIDPLLTSDTALNERVNGAIARIQSMQLYDGSFSMWPGNNTPYEWGSVYAAHFLLKARDAGINYPEEMFTGVLNWLRQFLASMPAYDTPDEERDDITTKAYAVYVLALNGERPLGWIEYLNENKNNLRPSGFIYLAGAQSLIDGNADALRNLTLGNNSGSAGRTLESETRNNALLLSMWLDVEPQATEVTELASRLVSLGSNGSWYSTQDNAWALISLARYNVEAAGAKNNLTAHVNTDTSDHALLTFTSNSKPAALKINDLPKTAGILIEAKGDGQGYYSWSINGFPKAQPKPERKNLNIECVYFDEAGNVLDPSQPVAHGKIIQVVLTVKPSMPISNLALNYLLPAGFELENPRLDDGVSNEDSYGVVNDIRDDRLILFFDRLKAERSYGFKMRAVTRGTFKVPQVSAYGMYDSTVRFTGPAQADIEIK
ncbi:MAG: Ig-like domain-containing protein [Synergistaceae bacterium]|nr:Ig-like domain-containing protein [Synergistaceae bacterium]